jgi:hypothetical protein
VTFVAVPDAATPNDTGIVLDQGLDMESSRSFMQIKLSSKVEVEVNGPRRQPV